MLHRPRLRAHLLGVRTRTCGVSRALLGALIVALVLLELLGIAARDLQRLELLWTSEAGAVVLLAIG